MTEDQLAQWELVKARRQKRLLKTSREMSLCCKARVWYLSKQNVADPNDPRIGESRCGNCSQPTSVILADIRPRQEPLFVIPAPPQAYRWAVEWRWKPEVFREMCPNERHVPENRWLAVRGYERTTTERQAVNECRRRRRIYPGKQFHVVVVEWTRHGEAHIHPGHDGAANSENTD